MIEIAERAKVEERSGLILGDTHLDLVGDAVEEGVLEVLEHAGGRDGVLRDPSHALAINGKYTITATR